MTVHGTFVWSDETIEVLRVLRKSGLTCAAIARELHTSRNSVTGKLDRLGVPAPHVASAPRKPRPPRRPRVEPMIVLSKATAPMAIPAAPPTQNSKPVSILDAKPNQCRSVLDQRDRRGRHSLAMFCGDQKTAGSSYCAFHDRLYRPAKDTINGKTSTHQ